MRCTQCERITCLRMWPWANDRVLVRATLYVQDAKARNFDDSFILSTFDSFPHLMIGLWWAHGWQFALQHMAEMRADLNALLQKQSEGGYDHHDDSS